MAEIKAKIKATEEEIKVKIKATEEEIKAKIKAKTYVKVNGLTIVESVEDLENLEVYEGMEVYVKELKSKKMYDGTSWVDISNIIQQYKTHYEFPNQGSENVLYIGLEEKKTWCWVNGGYVLLNDETADLKIDIIQGGNANG